VLAAGPVPVVATVATDGDDTPPHPDGTIAAVAASSTKPADRRRVAAPLDRFLVRLI
jgi:hypothetical protein